MIAKESFSGRPFIFPLGNWIKREGKKRLMVLFCFVFFCHQTGNLLTNLAARGRLADERAFLGGCIRMVRFISISILDAKWLMVLKMEILGGGDVMREEARRGGEGTWYE